MKNEHHKAYKSLHDKSLEVGYKELLFLLFTVSLELFSLKNRGIMRRNVTAKFALKG